MSFFKPAQFYMPQSFPRIYDENFVPSGLYIMISVPGNIYVGNRQHEYPAEPPKNVQFASYEVGAAMGHHPEEFHWDLYWHQGAAGGKIYRLQTRRGQRMVYEYESIEVRDVRCMLQCVGFVRVLTVEKDVAREIEYCVDWTTRSTASGCRRTFAWAIMSVYKIRRHLQPAEALSSFELHGFDMSRFIEELLRFAYDHVSATLKKENHGKNPIMPSWFGVDISPATVEEALMVHRERDMLVRRSRWFQRRPEPQRCN